jgi:hypothetical protein
LDIPQEKSEMMDYDFDVKRGLGWIIFLALAIAYIWLQLNSMSVDPNIAPSYLNFYQNLMNFVGWSLAIVFVTNMYLENRIGDILGINWPVKLMITGVFFTMIMAMTWGAVQVQTESGEIQGILPVPKGSVSPLALEPGEVFWTSAVVPAFTEDIAYLMAFPWIVLTFLSLIFKPEGRAFLLILMIISAGITTVGYNIWYIPGFTAAHYGAYGENQGAYVGASIFGFGQSMVYMITGWLAPVTHMAHNAYVSLGNYYSLKVDGLTILEPGG